MRLLGRIFHWHRGRTLVYYLVLRTHSQYSFALRWLRVTQWRVVLACLGVLSGLSLLPAVHGHSHAASERQCAAACNQTATDHEGHDHEHADHDHECAGRVGHDPAPLDQKDPSDGDSCTICLDLHLATCTPPPKPPIALVVDDQPAGIVGTLADSRERPMPLSLPRGRAPPATE